MIPPMVASPPTHGSIVEALGDAVCTMSVACLPRPNGDDTPLGAHATPLISTASTIGFHAVTMTNRISLLNSPPVLQR